MKKITILCVRALLWPKTNKDKVAMIKDQPPTRNARILTRSYAGVKIFCMMLLIIGVFMPTVWAQSTPVKPLMVGDKLPASFWEQKHAVYQDGITTSQTLANYKDQVILIDFWASWCTSCRIEMPLLDSLQSKYKGELKVLPVVTVSCKDKIAQIDMALKAVFGNSAKDWATVVDDRYLDSLFPHNYVPHYILIGKHGRVSAFLAPEMINEQTVLQAMNHTKPFRKKNEKAN